LCADIAGHNHDRVFEVNGAPMPIRQAAEQAGRSIWQLAGINRHIGGYLGEVANLIILGSRTVWVGSSEFGRAFSTTAFYFLSSSLRDGMVAFLEVTGLIPEQN